MALQVLFSRPALGPHRHLPMVLPGKPRANSPTENRRVRRSSPCKPHQMLCSSEEHVLEHPLNFNACCNLTCRLLLTLNPQPP